MIQRCLTSIAFLSLASFTCLGCGGSSGGGGGASPGPGQFMSASVQGVAPAVGLSVQASLNAIDSVSFPALQGTTPTVNLTGTATTGTVTLDFGASSLIGNATWSGIVVADYNVTGANTFDLSVDLTGLTFTSIRLGTVTFGPGSTLVLTGLTWNAGTTSASGIGDGANIIDIRWGGASYDLDIGGMHSWTFAATGAERQIIVGEFNFVRPVGAGSDDGYCELDDLDPLELTLVGSAREAVSGLAISVRSPGNQDNFTFDSSNGGTVLVVPFGQITGTTISFSL